MFASITGSDFDSPDSATETAWLFEVCDIERTRHTRFSTEAIRGKCSHARTPGSAVAMVPNSPRRSAGASGFGSSVSIWLGAPYR